MSKQMNYLYEFGPYRIDPAEQLLTRNGKPTPLPLKAFETLLVLVQNSNRLVEKDELMRQVWLDTVVEEANLTVHISTLRKVLGSEYIETVPKRGYRFTADVKIIRGKDDEELVGGQAEELSTCEEIGALVVADASQQSSKQNTSQPYDGDQRNRSWLAKIILPSVLALLLCLAIGIVIVQHRLQSEPPPKINKITILTPSIVAHQFYVRIDGSGFDPNAVRVVLVGPGCPSFGKCAVPGDAIKQYGGVSYTQLERVPLTLAPGEFQLFTQNGTISQPSSGIPLTVNVE